MSIVKISNLITDAEDTSGVFDVLMKSIETALDQQFKDDKLTGAEYANVYLGSIQAAMQQAVAYVLGVDIANAQAALLDQQLLTEVQNTSKGVQDVIVATNNAALILKQIDKITAEIALINNKTATEIKTALKVVAETDVAVASEALLVKQALTEIQQALLVIANTAKSTADTGLSNNKAATELKVALQVVQDTARSATDTLKIAAEDALIDQKLLTEVQTTLKVTAEKTLLDQKTDTEKAQILDTVNAVAVVGLVGKQKLLYAAQTDGFTRDAEQKLLKIMYDGWSVARSTDTAGVVNLPAEGNDTSLSAALNVAKTAVGM